MTVTVTSIPFRGGRSRGNFPDLPPRLRTGKVRVSTRRLLTSLRSPPFAMFGGGMFGGGPCSDTNWRGSPARSLFIACRNTDAEELERHLQDPALSALIDELDGDGWGPIHHLAMGPQSADGWRASARALETLLDGGANIDARNRVSGEGQEGHNTSNSHDLALGKVAVRQQPDYAKGHYREALADIGLREPWRAKRILQSALRDHCPGNTALQRLLDELVALGDDDEQVGRGVTRHEEAVREMVRRFLVNL